MNAYAAYTEKGKHNTAYFPWMSFVAVSFRDAYGTGDIGEPDVRFEWVQHGDPELVVFVDGKYCPMQDAYEDGMTVGQAVSFLRCRAEEEAEARWRFLEGQLDS